MEDIRELEKKIMHILQYGQATMSDKVKQIAELVKVTSNGSK